MKTFELKATVRQDVGKKSTKKSRRDGNVPCVMYGGAENISFDVVATDLRHLVYTGDVYQVNIDLAGKIHTAVMKSLQFHPLSDDLLHIDFLEITPEKKVVMQIPIKINGFAQGVRDGGKLIQSIRKLKVKATAVDMPGVLEINIDTLGLGQSLKIAALEFPGVELLDPSNLVVASVKATRASRLAETEAATPGKKK